MFKAFRWLKDLTVRQFWKPPRDRVLLQPLQQSSVQRVVMLGLGDCERIIQLLKAANAQDRVEFTGIDLFEMRQGEPHVSLREAHKRLVPHASKVRLLPGNPWTALSSQANNLLDTDVLLISADQDATELARAWFYVPRMIHRATQVYWEQSAATEEKFAWRLVDHTEIDRLAAQSRPRRAA